MNAEQKQALEGLIGRSLSTEEVETLSPLVAIRNDVEIARVLSEGRVTLTPRTITSRGVRATLPIKDAVAFLNMLREVYQAANANEVPTWIATALNNIGVPAEDHAAYMDTLACAHTWLAQEAGIDLGVQTTRDMLDLLALGDPTKYGTAVSLLKKLAEVPNPFNYGDVSVALNRVQE